MPRGEQVETVAAYRMMLLVEINSHDAAARQSELDAARRR